MKYKKLLSICLIVICLLSSFPLGDLDIAEAASGEKLWGVLTYGLEVPVFGDLTPSGLGNPDQRSGKYFRHDVRFKNVITNQHNPPSGYYEAGGFELQPNPGEEPIAQSGYFLVPLQESIIKNVAQKANGNPDFVWGSRSAFRQYSIDGATYVSFWDVMYYSGAGGSIKESGPTGDGITAPYNLSAYNISQKPVINRLSVTKSSLTKSELAGHTLSIESMAYSAGSSGNNTTTLYISGPGHNNTRLSVSDQLTSTKEGSYTYKVSKNFPLSFLNSFSVGTYTIRAEARDPFSRHADPRTIQITLLDDAPDPAEPRITADLTVNPSTIAFRDSFRIDPVAINVGSTCTYQSHQFRISNGSRTYTTPPITNINGGVSYSYATYPSVIGVGYHNVYIKVNTTNCGESDWLGGRSLIVTGPADNSPPIFRVGWTKPGVWKDPVTTAVVGDVLDLVYLDEPAPYDPDGDTFEFLHFDFAGSPSSWIRGLPSKYTLYGNGVHRVTMDEPGYHVVYASMRDQFGAVSTQYAVIDVLPPNPIPVISGQKEIVAGREFEQPISGENSYSPVGRTITDYIWENKRDIYHVPGVETISLEVIDNRGLRSLPKDKAFFDLIVRPDLPPIAKLELPTLAIRNDEFLVSNASNSPDGDQIVSADYRYKYDVENDGFANNNWVAVQGNLNRLNFEPSQIGKYLFDVYVCEDYGQCAWASDTQDESERIVDVINLAPEVTFSMQSEIDIPDLGDRTVYSPREIYSWPNYIMNQFSTNPFKNLKWYHTDGTITAGLGRSSDQTNLAFHGVGPEGSNQVSMPAFYDFGYGNNSLSPFRSFSNSGSKITEPLLFKRQDGTYDFISTRNMKIFSNEKYLFYHSGNLGSISGSAARTYSREVYAYNLSKVGNYEGVMEVDGGGWSTLIHTYKDGNDPVDFIFNSSTLGTQDLPRYTVRNRNAYNDGINRGDYSEWNETSKGRVSPKLVNHAVSDKTIYLTLIWDCESCVSFSDGSTRETYSIIEIRTYDAYSLEQVSSNFDIQNKITYNSRGLFMQNLNSYVHNDDMILVSRGGLAYKYNRQAELLVESEFALEPRRELTIGTTLYRCDFRLVQEEYFRDHNGNFIFYEIPRCHYNDTYRENGVIPANITIYSPDIELISRIALNMRPTGDFGYPTERWTFAFGFMSPLLDNLLIYNDPFRNQKIYRTVMNNGVSYTVHMLTEYANAILDISNSMYESRGPSGWSTSYSFTSTQKNFGLDWDRTYHSSNLGTVYTRDGLRVNFTNSLRPDGTTYTTWTQPNMSLLVQLSGRIQNRTNRQIGMTFVEDGIAVTAHTIEQIIEGNRYDNGILTYLITKGTPSNEPETPGALSHGQLRSPNVIEGGDYEFRINMHQARIDNKLTGFSFRMSSNTLDRYSIEIDGATLYFSKYKNGVREVLGSVHYPFQDNTEYKLKVAPKGSEFTVYINNVPYLRVDDDEYESGRFGYFSEKPNVTFSAITIIENEGLTEEINNIAIVDSEIDYIVMFEDPEDDVRLEDLDEWKYEQVSEKFLDAGDGFSGRSEHHEKTYNTALPELDKVGLYKVSFSTYDDPHADHLYPSTVFEEYREQSNINEQYLIVHRKPVADFTIELRENHTVIWHDDSYDPDRWLSEENYSDEDTGINYQETRGIVERKYYYITPSSQLVEEKLVFPEEVGIYDVGMAVKDEYGAWSNYFEVSLQVGELPPPNEPPVAEFEYSPSTIYRGSEVTITSLAEDPEDGSAENLEHEYWVRHQDDISEVLMSTERISWTTQFDKLGVYHVRQVVTDSRGQTDQITKEITVQNRAPSVVVTTPSSADPNDPEIIGDLKPLFRWDYADPDEDTQKSFQVLVYNQYGLLILDSGVVTSSNHSWRAIQELPVDTAMYVVVRAYDGVDWGAYSDPKWFKVGNNFEVVDIRPIIEYHIPNLNRPENKYFIVGKSGVPKYDVHVDVRNTIGTSYRDAVLTLRVKGYNEIVNYSQIVSIGPELITIVFTDVVNITEEQLLDYQRDRGPFVYSTLIYEAEITDGGVETTYEDNIKSTVVITGERTNSQLIR